MGLYLKKSFRAGPVRFNLSKSGLGLSAGVKGARIGTGPRGTNIHAGRYGLYYRKSMSSGRSRPRSGSGDAEWISTVLVIVGIIAVLYLVDLLLKDPIIIVVGGSIVLAIVVTIYVLRYREKKALECYRSKLDEVFVEADTPTDEGAIRNVVEARNQIPKTLSSKKKAKNIEMNVYQAVLDRILDDGKITDSEKRILSAVENVMYLDEDEKTTVKREIFSSAYVEAIQDHKITNKEMALLRTLIDGLKIPKEEVQEELDIVKEIVEAQNLSMPLEGVPEEDLLVRKQKSENAFEQCKAKVLSRRKSKQDPSGYEFAVKRDGTMVITDKRVFVVDEGTTSIPYSNIADIEVDLDNGMIVVSKSKSSRPTYLKTERPLLCAKKIELLMEESE